MKLRDEHAPRPQIPRLATAWQIGYGLGGGGLSEGDSQGHDASVRAAVPRTNLPLTVRQAGMPTKLHESVKGLTAE